MTITADTCGTRICSPEETLERIRPAFPKAGITRLANITGLDRLGIPVVAAIRPNSPTLATSAGKGLTLSQAKVSAAMEALELFCVENVRPTFVKQSYWQVAAHCAPLRNLELLLRPHVCFDRDWPRDWVVGHDLLTGEPVGVPLRLVNLCLPDAAYDLPIFQGSSNGLASGNDEREALLSALLELVERDAVTCFEHRWYGQIPPRIGLDTVEDHALRGVLGRLREAEIQVQLEDCTSDVGVPVMRARLLDEAVPALGVYHGQAAHPRPQVAALKAVLEAVQSRAVYISGSRDDCFHEELRLLRRSRFTENALYARSVYPDEGFPAARRSATGLEEDISFVFDALRGAGLEQIVMVDVSDSEIPVHAVKVIIPGLEGYVQRHYRSAGRASRSRMEGASRS